ncbi:MAG: hypothetical protein NVS2B6_14930 [Thermoleophilaceae bacterium]
MVTSGRASALASDALEDPFGPPGPGARSDREVAFLAYHDALTGLPNRTLLRKRMDAALVRAGADGSAVALLHVDPDDFKLVNDSLGHGAGDELLCEVASRLASVVRPGDTLARQGGDEFLIMLGGVELSPGGQSGDLARAIAERMWRQLSAALDEPFSIGHAVFRISASIGVSVFPDDAEDAETLQRHADAAMYSAKDGGGGVAVYEPRAADPLTRLSLAASMRSALAEKRFELHYQPIYELGAIPRIRGLEALIRWRDPERGMILPAEFVPVAERTGVIDAIGDWVIDTVIEQARAWQQIGLRPNFGVNVSPQQLRRGGFADELVARISSAGLDPRRFVLELTESSWMLDCSRTIPVVEALGAAGPRLAGDDVGEGYSSLSRLLTLPVDVVKIDRAFLADVPRDPRATALFEAILRLAETCECDVVAEGVETAEQLAFLTDKHCRLAQGFLLGRPAPPEAITPLLEGRLLRNRRAP